MNDLTRIEEPVLAFGGGQEEVYTRDGLSLFGPFTEPAAATLRIGYVGTESGLRKLRYGLDRLQRPVRFGGRERFRVPFPGFEAAFGCSLPSAPTLSCVIPEDHLLSDLAIWHTNQRIAKVVDDYLSPLAKAQRQEDSAVDLWVIGVTPEVFQHCRPKSSALRRESVTPSASISKKRMEAHDAGQLGLNLYEEDNRLIDTLQYRPDFRSQLKYRLLNSNAPVQLLREETLDNLLSVTPDSSERDLTHANDIAWNLSTALSYKALGVPWKLSRLRPGVCYVGLVFKRTDDRNRESKFACCAAQMFLNTGDGIVFRGAVGPWYSPEQREFHLDGAAAADLIRLATAGYKERFGDPPSELFIHGRAAFSDDEWAGFLSGADSSTNVVGIRIRDAALFRLYTRTENVALRGLALPLDNRHAVLQTSGWLPRLQTYPGREVPVPISVDVLRGDVPLLTVLQDVMALTKLNYNACLFADGQPVTLRFADSIGKILTAGPKSSTPPLQFKYYI